MEIQLKFDTDNAKERMFVRALASSLLVALDNVEGPSEQLSTVADGPAREAEPEAPVEEPKKRGSRKKKEDPNPAPTPAPEESDAEAAPEVPVEEPKKLAEDAPAKPKSFPTMTKDEWTEINHAKREELGLTVGGAHGDLIRDFNVYCQKNCELVFGNPKPSTLPAEELWQFAQWFQTIQLNPAYMPGTAESPFVSDVLSKE